MSKKIFNSSISSSIILIVFLVVINYFVSQNSIYFDLTEGKVYTVSDASKNILKNLEKEVDVNFYISKDLPVNLIGTKTQLMDLMNQYKDVSGGKLKVSYNEPENSQEKTRELAEKGIPQIQFNVVEKDKYEVKQGFFGVEITSGEGVSKKGESIPMIQSMDNWEYDFISAVYSVSQDKKEILGILSGHQEKELQAQDLDKSYEIQNVQIESSGDKKGFYFEKDVTKKDEKGGDKTEKEKNFITPKTLIVVGPSGKITAEEIAVVDDYIKNGGNVILLTESISVGNNLETAKIENGFNELTKKYGIEINNDLVYDMSNSNITYRQGQGFFSVSKPYPLWVKAVKENFGKNPALSEIQSIVFPWVSSIKISDSEGYVASSIISSTKNAKTMSDNYNLMPDNKLYFDGASQKILASISKPKDESSKSGSLVAIGDSDFVILDFPKQVSDNKTFFLNLVDSVSNSANLSSIRTKNIADRPIKEMNEQEKNYWKFISIFAAAALIDVYGFFRIMKRKKENR